MTFYPAHLAALSLLLWMTFDAAAAPCPGDNPRPHPKPPYDFITTSSVRAGGGGSYYTTCVENRTPDRVLWIDWFIPGPSGYIPGGESRPSKRFFSTRGSVDINGCLQYGNRWETMREFFIGNRKDLEAAEKQQDCRVRLSQTAGGDELPREL